MNEQEMNKDGGAGDDFGAELGSLLKDAFDGKGTDDGGGSHDDSVGDAEKVVDKNSGGDGGKEGGKESGVADGESGAGELLKKALKKDAASDTGKAGDGDGEGDGGKDENPEDAISLPDDAPEDRKSQFKKLKEITKALRGEVAAFKEKLSAKGGAEDAAARDEAKRLQEENRRLSDRLAAMDIREHPDYARNFLEPKKRAAEVAEAILKEHGIENPPDLMAVFSKPRAEAAKLIQELVDDIPELDKADFLAAVRAFRDVSFKEQEALKNAGELQAGMARKREQRQRAAFDKVFSSSDESGFLVEIAASDDVGDDEKSELASYNEGVRGIRRKAEGYAFGKMDDAGVALLAKKAATLDFIIEHGMKRLEREYGHVVALNKALAKKLEGVSAARATGTPAGDGRQDGAERDAFAELRDAFSK